MLAVGCLIVCAGAWSLASAQTISELADAQRAKLRQTTAASLGVATAPAPAPVSVSRSVRAPIHRYTVHSIFRIGNTQKAEIVDGDVLLPVRTGSTVGNWRIEEVSAQGLMLAPRLCTQRCEFKRVRLGGTF